jgi:hypothetical protein
MTNEEFIADAKFYKRSFYAKSHRRSGTWLLQWKEGEGWQEREIRRDEWVSATTINHFFTTPDNDWKLSWADDTLIYDRPARPTAEDWYEHMRLRDP